MLADLARSLHRAAVQSWAEGRAWVAVWTLAGFLVGLGIGLVLGSRGVPRS